MKTPLNTIDTIHVIRENIPEQLGHQRLYEIAEASKQLEETLHAMGLSLTDELPDYPIVPQSSEVQHYSQQQAERTHVSHAPSHQEVSDISAAVSLETAFNSALSAGEYPHEFMAGANN